MSWMQSNVVTNRPKRPSSAIGSSTRDRRSDTLVEPGARRGGLGPLERVTARCRSRRTCWPGTRRPSSAPLPRHRSRCRRRRRPAVSASTTPSSAGSTTGTRWCAVPGLEAALDADRALGSVAVVVVAEARAEALGHRPRARAIVCGKPVEHAHAERRVVGRRRARPPPRASARSARRPVGRRRPRSTSPPPGCRPTRAPSARRGRSAPASSSAVSGPPAVARAAYSPSRSPRWTIPAVTAPLSLVNTLNEYSFRRSGSAAMSAMGPTVDPVPHARAIGVLPGAIVGREVLDVAQLRQAERVAVVERHRLEPADRGVAEHEAVPLPRRRPADRADDRWSPSWCRRGRRAGSARPVPRSARSADRPRCVPRLGRPGSPPLPLRMRATNSRTDSPPSRPDQRSLGGSAAQFGIGVGRLLRRRAVPLRVADLLQPGVDLLVAPEPGEQWFGRLLRPHERRHEHLVEDLLRQQLGEVLGLRAAPFGERRIDDVQATAHPFRFPMAHEHDLHPPDRTDRRPHRPTRFGPSGAGATVLARSPR